MLMGGIGGTVNSAYLCQSLLFGPAFGHRLDEGGLSPCIGAATMLRFGYDTQAMTYSVEAGDYATDINAPATVTAVEIASTTAGTLNDGDPDTITDIPADTDVTIVIQNWDITFQINATQVTVSAFDYNQ